MQPDQHASTAAPNPASLPPEDMNAAYILGAITASLLKDGWKFHAAEPAKGLLTLDVEGLCGPTTLADLIEPGPGVTLTAPEHPKHVIRTATKQRRKRWDEGWHVSITGDVGVYVGPEAMGINWMTGNELCEAIPPAYTEVIGQQLMAATAADCLEAESA